MSADIPVPNTEDVYEVVVIDKDKDKDENEAEATTTAVTTIGMAGSSLPPEPTELKFNKPFYFAIRDNTKGGLL